MNRESALNYLKSNPQFDVEDESKLIQMACTLNFLRKEFPQYVFELDNIAKNSFVVYYFHKDQHDDVFKVRIDVIKNKVEDAHRVRTARPFGKFLEKLKNE